MKLVEQYIRISLTLNEQDLNEIVDIGNDLYFERKLVVSRLDHLTINFVDFIWTQDGTNRSMGALTELFKETIRLSSITFCKCSGLRDDIWTCIPTQLQRLSILFSVLDDDGFTNDSIELINERTNGGLEELTLKNCDHVTDDGMKYIGSKLRRLSLISMDLITNEGIRRLPSTLKSLTLMNLDSVTSLFTNLESLRFKHSKVKDEDIQAVGTRLSSLAVLNSMDVTDDGLASIAGRLRHLEINDIDGEGKITYRTINRATQLHSLAINSYFGVEEVELSQQLTQLRIMSDRSRISPWMNPLPESLRELTIDK